MYLNIRVQGYTEKKQAHSVSTQTKELKRVRAGEDVSITFQIRSFWKDQNDGVSTENEMDFASRRSTVQGQSSMHVMSET